MGRRISETDNGTLSKQWIWVGANLAEERDSSNTVTKRFFAQGEQIDGTPYFYSRDRLGSIREMSASDGTVDARYDYDPYGRTAQVGPITVGSDFQYAGYYEHAASGLNLTLFRAYDPNAAKWLSRDPLENAEQKQGPNLYAYVHNNPVDWRDPLGLAGGGGLPQNGFGGAKNGSPGSGCPEQTEGYYVTIAIFGSVAGLEFILSGGFAADVLGIGAEAGTGALGAAEDTGLTQSDIDDAMDGINDDSDDWKFPGGGN
jgi:RHS repeat-associated protein